MHKNRAIILKTFWPERQRIVLFDYTMGRIQMGITQSIAQHIVRGALITYIMNSKTKVPNQLSDLYVEAVPLMLARSDLLFIHGLLELMYHTFPPLYACKETFELVWHILEKWQKVSSSARLLVVAQLLARVGLMDEEAQLPADILHYLISLRPGDILEEQLSRCQRQELSNWIGVCLSIHPYKDTLTIVRANHEVWHEKN